MRIPFVTPLVALAALVAPSVVGCASPTDGVAERSETVASTSQAISLSPNCDALGNSEFACYARDVAYENNGVTAFNLINLLSAWDDDLLLVSNSGTVPIRVNSDQFMGASSVSELQPGDSTVLRRVDDLYPAFGVWMAVDSKADMSQVKLSARLLNK